MVRKPVHEEVVDDASVLAAHRGILRLPDLDLGRIVDRDALDQIQRARTADEEFSHVSDVEDTDVFSHRPVLLSNARRVLYRHLEPGERYHLPTESHVLFVEGSAL